MNTNRSPFFSLLIALFFTSTLNITTSFTQDAPVYMYWTDLYPGKIQRANLDGTNVQDIVTGLGRPVGIALDLAGGKMYWTDRDNHNFNDPNARTKILRANIDGSNIETLVTGPASIQLIEEIALDLAAGKMYWTDVNDTGAIRRANLDGSNIETLVTEMGKPWGIALDPTHGKMYWSDVSEGKIQRANLDGSNLETLLTGLSTPHHVALDFSSGKIYWTTHKAGKIQRANFDGSNLEDIVTGSGGPIGIALDNLNGRVYWADPHTDKIQRANLDGTNVEDVATGLDNPVGITLGTPQMIQRPILSFVPSPVQSPSVGQQLTLNLNITGGEAVAGYQASVQFDTTALRHVESSNGDYLPDGAFFAPPVVDGNLVKLNAVSLAGETNGDGTLATLTFEVIAVKASTLILSDVLLTNSAAETFVPQIENAEITESTGLKGDVNGDGTVNISDLVLVASNLGKTGQNAADVNADGIVNIADLVLVAEALGTTATAPSLHLWAPEVLTAADVKQWLSQAQLMNLTDTASQRGIQFLEQLLVTLTRKETALLANYPNPFNPETWIPYHLAKSADVTLTIYAIDGQIVRRLELGHQPAGMYQNRSRAAYWDGRNAFGEPVASGVYFYTLTTGDFTATRKMLIRK